jgi:predicted ATP-dependent serine protease
LNKLEHFVLKKFLLRYGVNIDTGAVDMNTVVSALLSFLSSPLAQTIVTDAEVELKGLVVEFLKAHIKNSTPPVPAKT